MSVGIDFKLGMDELVGTHRFTRIRTRVQNRWHVGKVVSTVVSRERICFKEVITASKLITFSVLPGGYDVRSGYLYSSVGNTI